MKRVDLVRWAIALFKFVSGGLEVVSGVALTILPKGALTSIVNLVVAEEAREDPHDPAVTFIQTHLAGFLDQRGGVAVGLIVLGVVKIVGAYGLLRRRAWGYYLLVAVLVALLGVEVGHLSEAQSAAPVIVTAANVVALALMLIFRRRFIEHQTGAP
ncbi:MAG: putative rane protein [Actinomycetota bacterium]|nr:putative rane protein [Actinomycetota bacterium]